MLCPDLHHLSSLSVLSPVPNGPSLQRYLLLLLTPYQPDSLSKYENAGYAFQIYSELLKHYYSMRPTTTRDLTNEENHTEHIVL